MNEPMSDSYKKAVEEFKKWVENSLGRSEDFSKGISPRPRYEPPSESPFEIKNLAIADGVNVLSGDGSAQSNRPAFSLRVMYSFQ